jgi:hypothetical protein
MTDTTTPVRRIILTGQAEQQLPTMQADHAMGLELQIVELVEQQTRARVQHRDGDADRFEAEIGQLRSELAASSDTLV